MKRFPEHLTSERTAHRRLSHLVELGHLATAAIRSTSPCFPHVYLATAQGVRWIRELAEERGLTFTVSPAEERREQGRALDSLLHELLLTEFELACHVTTQSREDLSIPVTERRYFRQDKRLRYYQEGTRRDVIPDAGFLLKLGGEGTPETPQNLTTGFLMHFTEMDNATMSLPRMADKFQSYDDWSQSESGQDLLLSLYRKFGADQPRVNFRLLVICHDKLATNPDGDHCRLVDLFAQSLHLPRRMRDRIWFTTVEHLRNHQDDIPPLLAAMWLRVRDANLWIQEFRSYLASLPKGRGQKKYHHQRTFVSERINNLPLHPLFPHQNMP